MLPLIIELISGAVGGNVASNVLKQCNLGTLGNSIAGVLGAASVASCSVCWCRLSVPPQAGGGADLGSIAAQIAGGGTGGSVLLVSSAWSSR